MESAIVPLFRSVVATTLIVIGLTLLLTMTRAAIAPLRSSTVDLDEPAGDTGAPRDGHANERSSQ